ncbi:MAG: right-handed parallel beta-helix repeat-containing protein [Ferruginibacter sp.]
MKNILLFILFVSVTSLSKATNYYLSSAGSDANAGTTSAAPLKTIAKLNTLSLSSGDSVLFKRGDTFYGSITKYNTGVKYDAYGSGSDPVITAMIDVTGWTSAGTNLWQSSPLSFSSNYSPMVLTKADILKYKGRWPNTGYMYFEAKSGTSSITDLQLPSSPSWTGASLVLKQNAWTINTYPITSHAGTVIYFGGNSAPIRDNHGYFITDAVATLDQQDEWFYNKVSKRIVMYGTSMPVDIQVSAIDTIFYIKNKNNISIKNIVFDGANKQAVTLDGTSGVTIQNASFKNSGHAHIRVRASSGTVIAGNTLLDSYTDGLSLSDIGNANITASNNVIRRCGVYPGMNQNGANAMNGITIVGNGHTISGNTIDSAGYSGMRFDRAANLNIQNNVISNYCITSSDGAGIYTWNNYASYTEYQNRKNLK